MKDLIDLIDEMNACNLAYDDFTDRLCTVLEEMKVNRQSVEEILDAIESYDVIELYDSLFTRFGDLLSQSENNYYLEKYKQTFIPLDSI